MTTWNLTETTHHVLICNGSSCMRKGGEEVTQAIRDQIANLDLDTKIHTSRTRCNGRCKDACVVIVYPEGTWYKAVNPETGSEIVTKHLAGGEVVNEAVIYQYKQKKFVAPDNSTCILGVSKPSKGGV